MPRGMSGSTGTPQGNRFWGEGDSRQAPSPCSSQSRPAGMGPRISISGNFASSAEPAALSEQLQQAGTFSLGVREAPGGRASQGRWRWRGIPDKAPAGAGMGEQRAGGAVGPVGGEVQRNDGASLGQ